MVTVKRLISILLLGQLVVSISLFVWGQSFIASFAQRNRRYKDVPKEIARTVLNTTAFSLLVDDLNLANGSSKGHTKVYRAVSYNRLVEPTSTGNTTKYNIQSSDAPTAVNRHAENEATRQSVTDLTKQSATMSMEPKTNLRNTIVLAFYKPLSILHVKPQAELASKSMSHCAYSNCQIVFAEPTSGHVTGDAVIFQGNEMPETLPLRMSPDQPFIFLDEEAPQYYHITRLDQPVFRNFFNWTMTYRLDSDIVYAYGAVRKQVLVQEKNYTQIFRRKTQMSAWFVSHCSTASKREEYAKKLSNYTQVHVYGNCGTFAACPYENNGKAKCGLEIAGRYKFYLAFENSMCTDYVTEKAYDWYARDIIIVARGPGNYSQHLPPGTFIDTTNFKSIKELAIFLNHLGTDEKEYVAYLKRKDQFSVIHRDQVRQNAYCKLCEYVNQRDMYRKWYGDINAWWTGSVCKQPHDLD